MGKLKMGTLAIGAIALLVVFGFVYAKVDKFANSNPWAVPVGCIVLALAVLMLLYKWEENSGRKHWRTFLAAAVLLLVAILSVSDYQKATGPGPGPSAPASSPAHHSHKKATPSPTSTKKHKVAPKPKTVPRATTTPKPAPLPTDTGRVVTAGGPLASAQTHQ